MTDQIGWTHVPVSQTTLHRLIEHKIPKPRRQKHEHYLETINDLIVRLLDFYDENEGNK